MLLVFIATSVAFALLAFVVVMGLVFYAGGMANGKAGENPRALKRLDALFLAPGLLAPAAVALAVWGYRAGAGYWALAWYLLWVVGTVALFLWVHRKRRLH